MKKIALTLFILLISTASFSIAQEESTDPQWIKTWSESLFEQAKKENKFVILDLEAIWCHWCHVMKKETYSDPGVTKLLKEHYIPVRIDQDSRPDIANRYRDYGWPATIVFNSKGEEIIKRSGYISPEEMKETLRRIIDNPTPEEPELDETKIKFSTSPILSNELKEKLKEEIFSSYDPIPGGLKLSQKFLDSDSAEYYLIEAKAGNKECEKMARKTLDATKSIIDPVWGGAYQYSTMSGWNYPHFEKLTPIQARFIRIYSKAYSKFKDPSYLKAGEDVYRYVKSFLTSSDGVFYVSQDADLVQGEHASEYFKKNDAERRKLGIPRVDKHIYSNQNGLVIDALVNLYNATNDKKYLDEAISAAKWIIQHRTLSPNIGENLNWIFSDWTSPESVLKKLQWTFSNMAWAEQGFKHNKIDQAGPFLSDSLNMGKAFVSLYKATSDKKWLIHAEQAARFTDRHFRAPVAGFATSEASCKVCAVRAPSRLTEENIELARFTNSLFKITKENAYKEIVEYAMKYLVTPEIALKTLTEPGILIADLEIND